MLFTNALKRSAVRRFHTRLALRHPAGLENILGGGPAPPVQVRSIGEEGLQLADGLVIPSACIFLDGQVFLWKVPSEPWDGWTKNHFRIFDVVVPKPEILLLGTGKHVAPLPQTLRNHLNQQGIQVDIMDTRNACSTYNLLAEEGRRVAAALLPQDESSWDEAPIDLLGLVFPPGH
jgi:NADH dehydrogenase [ubiquinone] 1 alpha subcomplex assembly factor 3